MTGVQTCALPIYRRVPVLKGERNSDLVIIGDSISAGIGDRVQSWPSVMNQMAGVKIKNLSKPGAAIADGLAMADRVIPEDRLILIELGGNDLIAGQPSAAYETTLEKVLAKLAAPGRTQVMFELPLVPTMVGYGQAQRRLARKYGVWLIPKRCFTKVISGEDATSDGLHLTDVGARRMAALVTEILSPVLEVQAAPPTAPAKHP